MLPLITMTLLLFGGALWFQRRYRRYQPHPAHQALAMLSCFGGLILFGMTEMAGRYGLSALLAFIAFSVVFLFGSLIMRPLQWAVHQRHLPTLSDLFSYRYRGRRIGALVTATLLLSCLPLVAGQLQIAGQILSPPGANPTLYSALFGTLVVLFILLNGLRREALPALVSTLAVNSAVVLISLLLCAALISWDRFGDLAAMEQWAVTSGQSDIIRRFDHSYGLVSLFLLASLTLPHLYSQQAQAQPSGHQVGLTSWLFPLLLMLATLTMFPLLWSGLASQLHVPLQFYLLALTDDPQWPWLRQLVLLAGLLACAGVIIAVTLSLSRMATHHSLTLTPGASGDLYRRQITHRRGFSLAWLALALLASQGLRTDSITTLTLVTLVGTAQLAPGMLAALYVPILNRRGVLVGLGAGLGLWCIGLLLPLFTGGWFWRPGDSALGIHFGVAHWSGWLLCSLAVNFCAALLVSRVTRTDHEEALHARACMMDHLTLPMRLALEHCDRDQLQRQLSRQIGTTAARQELQACYRELQLSGTPWRPFEWRALRERLLERLYDLLGVVQAERVMAAALPTAAEGGRDLRTVETLLAGQQQQLSGLAAELNRLRLHHRQILQGLPMGVCALDDNLEIALWNRALIELTGIDAERAAGARLDSLPEPWRSLLTDAAESHSKHRFALEIAVAGRTLWLNLHKSMVTHNSDGEQVILLEDVTDALRRTRDLAHTERLASVGRLAAGVAHEIGNPVTGIACLAQDILAEDRRTANNPELSESASLILTQTDRITRIVRALIDFSRSGSEHQLQLQSVPLHNALSQARQLLQLQKELTEVDYQIDCADHLAVRGDPHQLVQVFLNLMSNARDASAPGDPIAIRAHRTPDRVTIEITDCGGGIPTDKLDKVLEPFFTTKDPGEGTGLGLALVYSMVRSYGGDLQLHSPVADGRGTRVTVTLPAA